MNVAATWETLLHLQRDGFPFNARMLFASRFKSEPVSFSRLELWYIPLDYSATHWSLFMLCLKALIWMKWPFRSRGRRVNRHLKAEDGRPPASSPAKCTSEGPNILLYLGFQTFVVDKLSPSFSEEVWLQPEWSSNLNSVANGNQWGFSACRELQAVWHPVIFHFCGKKNTLGMNLMLVLKLKFA